jgi:hypothetical protein
MNVREAAQVNDPSPYTLNFAHHIYQYLSMEVTDQQKLSVRGHKLHDFYWLGKRPVSPELASYTGVNLCQLGDAS